MHHFLTTALFAIIIVIGGLLLLAIGWLLTGKTKLQPGACGRPPKAGGCEEKRHCHLCDNNRPSNATDNEEIEKK